jgi:hypothetical protein
MNKTITRFLTTSSALLISFVALQGSAAAQVTVYSDINFEGNSRTFNGDVANLTDQGFNDAISSIQIPQGEQWQFCQDANYGGSCQTLQGSIADLRNINWNDRISSIRRVRGGVFNRNRSYYPGTVGTSGYGASGIAVFTNPNFGGRSASFNGDVADLRQYNMNDQITSIQIPNGETWEICQDINFDNQCTTVSGSVADLRGMGWNDRISSMRRVSGSGYRSRRYGNGRYDDRRYDDTVGTSGSYSNQRGLVFFDRPNFRGGTTLVTNSGSTGAVPRAGSVQVRGGGVWRVCDNQGDCANVDRDVNDMRELGLNGRITSVREVNNRRFFPFNR